MIWHLICWPAGSFDVSLLKPRLTVRDDILYALKFVSLRLLATCCDASLGNPQMKMKSDTRSEDTGMRLGYELELPTKITVKPQEDVPAAVELSNMSSEVVNLEVLVPYTILQRSLEPAIEPAGTVP